MAHKPLVFLLIVAASGLFLEPEAVSISPSRVGIIGYPGIRVHPGLSDICNKTDFFIECISTVAPLLKNHTINPIAVLKAEITAAGTELKEAKQFMDKLLASYNSTISPIIKHCFSICKENFDSAINSLRDSLASIALGNGSSLRTQLRNVTTNIETCRDAFNVTDLKIPDIVGLHLWKISKNCLALSQRVRH